MIQKQLQNFKYTNIIIDFGIMSFLIKWRFCAEAENQSGGYKIRLLRETRESGQQHVAED